MNDDLAARISGLSPAKRALLERRLTSGTTRGNGPVAQERPSGVAPTSFAQRSQWFVYQLDPDNSFFNKTDAVRIGGPLDVAALEATVTALVARHEILRTGYTAIDGEPHQVIRPAGHVTIPVVDLSSEVATSDRQRLAELHRLLAAERRRPFDLANDPMLRVKLFRLGPEDHVFAKTTHHISYDRWSMGIGNREFSELFAAVSDGGNPALEPMPYQYADFAEWQRVTLDEDAIEHHLAFFASHLAGAPQVLDLPTDRRRPATQAHPGASFSETLDRRLTDAVRSFARSQGATVFMVTLAAYAAMIGRYARKDQFLLGVPAAGRTAPGTEQLLGLFINSMVMRMDLRGEPTFAELVARVRAATLGAVAHQDLPFDRLVERLASGRTRGRTPMFQVMFDFINTPGERYTLGSLELEPLAIEDEASVYDVSLYVIEEGPDLRTIWEYRTDLFDRPTIVRMAKAFVTVLESAVADPSLPIAELPLVDDADRARIGGLGTGPARATTDGSDTLRRIRAAAAARPDTPAVQSGDTTVTYGELWKAAESVTERLHDTVTPGETAVGLLTGRTPQLVSGLLGILGSGRTAVLLDPDQPADRLTAMLDAADVRTVMTSPDATAAAHLARSMVLCRTQDNPPPMATP